MQLNENRIREYAYQIWESEGKPNGSADEHWYKACKSLEAEARLSEPNSSETEHGEDSMDNFIPHQNTKKGKHAHHASHPHSH